MTTVISVENLGKKYNLSHKSKERYKSLRDVLTKKFSSIKPINTPPRNTEEFWALKEINFEIKQGEKVGIIGRNGAGKSTLLKILSRITEPSTGKIQIKGKVASLLEVGTGFHPELTGRENIYLNGAILGMSRIEIKKKFDEIVAFSEVEKFLDTPVKRYSSGMYMRLAFAVAAHLEPEILVVDEVLAVGDAQFQKKCLGKMEEIGKSGRTVLFVSHNLDAVTTLCDKGIVLNNGKVDFVGSAEDARAKYLNHSLKYKASVYNNAGRGGTGGVSIEYLAVESGDTLTAGNSLLVALRASVDDKFRHRKDLQVAFGIDSEDGVRLYTFLSSWINYELNLSSGEINLNWQVQSLPLVPGKYFISASVIFQGETLDSILHCGEFFVTYPKKHMHIERLHGWGPLDLNCQIYSK
ncbi:polysaccharide ABC transporter ATP-binding protein [Methylophilus glucosoxydans]|uniref:Polysaccharide ABC transporter ATP-binding protein n=1 Tax=Methylophilus glucosoxydans TaxID=752553 RepID=A0ABW3GIC4_9PROT